MAASSSSSLELDPIENHSSDESSEEEDDESSSDVEEESCEDETSEDDDEPPRTMILHDGDAQVNMITVMVLVRNNSNYLSSYLLPRLAIMESLYFTDFRYCFLENNSKDDTAEQVSAFMTNRKGFIKSLDLPEFQNLGVNFARTERLAMLRNTLAKEAKPDMPEKSWCLMLDSDIMFDVLALRDMFSKKPRSNNIGMMSAFTTEAIFGRQVNKTHEQFKHLKDDDMVSMNHYADTFAFVGQDSRNLRPKCAFNSCKMCGIGSIAKDGHKDELLDVKSCYNGFAIVDADAIKNDHVRWDTVDIEGHHSLCEHVLFCHSLRAATGKRVCIAMDVDKVFWTNP